MAPARLARHTLSGMLGKSCSQTILCPIWWRTRWGQGCLRKPNRWRVFICRSVCSTVTNWSRRRIRWFLWMKFRRIHTFWRCWSSCPRTTGLPILPKVGKITYLPIYFVMLFWGFGYYLVDAQERIGWWLLSTYSLHFRKVHSVPSNHQRNSA